MVSKVVENNLIKEKCFFMQHSSGLNIYVYPKKDYNSTFAIFSVKFGSINNKFKINGEENFISVPDGIAHYLEHKLFESVNGNMLKIFSAIGAHANASTSFERTSYFFSCTENFERSLEQLLNLVQSPYFTKKNVQKERGIIDQEIKLYKDSPDYKLFFNLLGALYKNHPVKINIAGSESSISKITPEFLYKCYDAFYTPDNMVLCIAGNVDPNKVLYLVNKNLKLVSKFKVEKCYPLEPVNVEKKLIVEEFDIKLSMFCLGFKEEIPPGKVRTCKELAYTDIILECIASKTSDMYQDLLSKGLINISSFSVKYFEGPGYAAIIFSGESINPKKVARIIKNYANKIRNSGINKETFEKSKKALYGQKLTLFNGISDIAKLSVSLALFERDLFEYINEIANSNLETANKEISKHLDSKYCSLSVLVPKKYN